MTEYIDKAKAIEEIEDFKGSVTRDSSAEWDAGVDEGFDYAVSVIELMDASDVAPVKRGKWVTNHIGMFECTNCRKMLFEKSRLWNYCPMCGALMDGEEDEND